MIANTISRIIARVLRWSSTGNAAARPDRCPASPMSQGASPKYRDCVARSKPINQSGAPITRSPRLNGVCQTTVTPLKSP
jgi:hypothetical protein